MHRSFKIEEYHRPQLHPAVEEWAIQMAEAYVADKTVSEVEELLGSSVRVREDGRVVIVGEMDELVELGRLDVKTVRSVRRVDDCGPGYLERVDTICSSQHPGEFDSKSLALVREEVRTLLRLRPVIPCWGWRDLSTMEKVRTGKDIEVLHGTMDIETGEIAWEEASCEPIDRDELHRYRRQVIAWGEQWRGQIDAK